ncbi:hypothetical protein A2U01_0029819, partial [Trifolium medium]|nr:hypothetical protein [Trifolium medium]
MAPRKRPADESAATPAAKKAATTRITRSAASYSTAIVERNSPKKKSRKKGNAEASASVEQDMEDMELARSDNENPSAEATGNVEGSRKKVRKGKKKGKTKGNAGASAQTLEVADDDGKHVIIIEH